MITVLLFYYLLSIYIIEGEQGWNVKGKKHAPLNKGKEMAGLRGCDGEEEKLRSRSTIACGNGKISKT